MCVFISFFLASPPIYLYMVWVCLYKVFFCQSQHWRLRLGKYGSTDKTHESHTLTHSWSTRLRWNFHWNTQQWQPNTHEHTPMHTDRWESMFAFLFCLLFFSNVIIELPHNYVLHKFSERSRYRASCVLLYHYRRSLQLIGCCSLSVVCMFISRSFINSVLFFNLWKSFEHRDFFCC